MRKMLWATATAAFLVPRRAVSRRNCAARYVLVRLAACAASTSAVRNHRLPFRVLPLRRFPALSSWPSDCRDHRG